ncbi:MAG: SCO family protein, partial [Candidatus Paceibacterota bacterium]
LLKITSILKLLGADRNKINPLFISIDPKRDTPERLKTYLANFDSKLVGLTGTQENIDQASQIFRAYYNEIALKGDYTFDHSSVIYFMDPKGNYANYFSSNMTEQEIVNLIKKEISG